MYYPAPARTISSEEEEEEDAAVAGKAHIIYPAFVTFLQSFPPGRAAIAVLCRCSPLLDLGSPHGGLRVPRFTGRTCYRDGDWKVVYHYFPSEASENSHYQLYNLAEDPFESNNLATSRPDQLRLMIQGLAAALEQHNAVYPVDKEDGSTPLKPKLP